MLAEPPNLWRIGRHPCGRYQIRGRTWTPMTVVAGKASWPSGLENRYDEAIASGSGQGSGCDLGRPGGPRWPGRGHGGRWSRPPTGCVAVCPWLPDTHPSRGLEPQLVGSADIKRGVKLVEVPHDLVATELAGGMPVDGEQPDDFRVPSLVLPGTSPRQEEALRARQTVDYRCLFAVQRHQIGLPCDAQASEIPDILPDRQRSVHMLVRSLLRRQAVVLLDQRPGPGFERLPVLCAPPVGEPAVTVRLGTLVVEAVADLVTDDRADRSVIGRIVAARIEERILQDRSREHNLVHARVVVGVDHLGSHEPLVMVDRLADLVHLAVELESMSGTHVGHETCRIDPQAGVVPPSNRVADLRRELPQLVQGPPAGVCPHPFELLDALAVGLEEVGHQDIHPLPGPRREVPADVGSADSFPHRPLDQRDTALPALTQLGGAAQGAAVKVEIL